MHRRIKNTLKITCDDVNLKTVSNIEFYLRQRSIFYKYTPDVISEHEMIVTIPFDDAMTLSLGGVDLQFVFTDSEGNPTPSDIVTVLSKELLCEVGYDPI